MFHRSVRREIDAACATLRDELDDHLDAINEGSRDISEIREVLSAFDEKLEKLHGRIDELFLLLGADTQLTAHEQALVSFLQAPRTLAELGSFLGLTSVAVERALQVLSMKGVAVFPVARADEVLVTANPALKGNVSLRNYL